MFYKFFNKYRGKPFVGDRHTNIGTKRFTRQPEKPAQIQTHATDRRQKTQEALSRESKSEFVLGYVTPSRNVFISFINVTATRYW